MLHKFITMAVVAILAFLVIPSHVNGWGAARVGVTTLPGRVVVPTTRVVRRPAFVSPRVVYRPAFVSPMIYTRPAFRTPWVPTRRTSYTWVW
jgi:hypothetical protein